MKNNSQHMFLVNFISNEVCFIPKSKNVPILYDWYPVVIDNQEQGLSDIIHYNFENMKQLALNDIIEIKKDRTSIPKNVNIFKRLVEQITLRKKHTFAPSMLKAS